MSRQFKTRASGAVLAFATFMTWGTAQAEQPLAAIIGQGKAIVDLRARYEAVDDASRAQMGKATTIRARLGYETGYWNGLKAGFDFDAVWALGSETYNSTRNGKTTLPVILDPAMTALNRLFVTYASDFDTNLTLGRQRIIIGNQRFVGNVGWRQHEQTFDALTLVNTSIEDLTFTYGYLYRVNRIGGPSAPVPSTTNPAATAQANYLKSDSQILDAVYVGIENLKLEGYAFLLDFKPPSYATLAAQQTAVARLSTATLGLRGDYSLSFSDDLTGKLTAEYAHQSEYGANPLSLSLSYFLAEGSLSHGGFTGLIGYEYLEGNGVIGFATPLATLHAFNGWADLFLATPVNGLTDLYFKLSYTTSASIVDMKSFSVAAVYHDYTTDRLGQGIGSEWNLQAELTVDKNASFLVKYAVYDGAGIPFGGFADKSIAWLQAAYKL